MGKSLGNTLEPNDLVPKFGADAVRYFFLREVEFGNDGDYSEDRFVNIVNAHLANTIGISILASLQSMWITGVLYSYLILNISWAYMTLIILCRKSS